MSEDHFSYTAPVVDEGNREFPIAFSRFAAMIQGTPHEVWTHWLRRKHGREAHTEQEWHNLIKSYHDHPAHPSVLRG